MEKKAKKTKKSIISNVIVVCLAGSSVVFGYKVYDIEKTYNDNQEEYDDLVEEVVENSQSNRNIDFDKLREINPDVEGWIKYNGTHIDYPIVQGEDNSEYLNESFEGNNSSFGTLFIDSECSKPFDDFITIVYGHHMRNGSMFGDLKKLKDENYYKEHPELELYTEDKDCILEICAFLNEKADSDVYTINITNEKDKKDYINMIKELSLYKTDTVITPNDKLVILSTCAYESNNARYIVVCKLIDENTYLEAYSPYINNEKVLVRQKTKKRNVFGI